MILLLSLFALAVALASETFAQTPAHPSLPACSRSDSQLLLPDLIVETPASSRTALRGGRRLLEFATSVANVGAGPLIIEGRTVVISGAKMTQGFQIIQKRDGGECARHAGFFEFHPAHSHWHFEDFVSYELRSGDPASGPFATTGRKASYCLLDLETVGRDTPPRQLTNQSCNSSEGRQGISVGWKDVYDRTLPDQNLDLDEPVSVAKGSYFLANVVDPTNRIWEANENNNRSYVPVTVSIDGRVFPTYAPPAATPTPTLRSSPEGSPTRVRPRRPDRRPRPTLRPRPNRPGSTPTPQPTPTATATRRVDGESCAPTCSYATQQMRFTWYDAEAGGLNLSFSVRENICPTLTPEVGERGSITMSRWLTERGQDTGRLHRFNFTVDANGVGQTSDGGTIRFTQGRTGTLVTFTSNVPPTARAGLGLEFPVVFNLCITLGDQTLTSRLVCQEKPQGLLCHAG